METTFGPMTITVPVLHECCHHARATKAVLADRERELLQLKGACSTEACRLHYAHSGPCHIRPHSE